jgi:thiol-disulfide isomerase/thioredoxin
MERGRLIVINQLKIFIFVTLFNQNMKLHHLALLFSILFLGCNSQVESEAPSIESTNESPEITKEIEGLMTQGLWIGKLRLSETEVLPFNMEVVRDSVYFINADERLGALVHEEGEQLVITMPIFDSEFRFSLNETGVFGFWHNYAKSKDYKIDFVASPSIEENTDNRFSILENEKFQFFSGSWETTFSEGEEEYKALGILNQINNTVTGTFLTETGDFRYLQGNCIGDSIYLSAFDGSHAFLFKAKQENDTLYGTFYSGSHYQTNFTAFRNGDFELADPDTLTKMKVGAELEFSFPGLDGTMVEYPSMKYSEKVTIIQILGSWCPNCMDETAYLSDLHNSYKEQGLRVIGISFENPTTLQGKIDRVKQLKKHFNATYDFCIGGDASKQTASSVLPALSDVLSFPTTIYIDKSGVVRKIHTGFNGPGTGAYYLKYAENTRSFVTKLLAE